MIPTYKVGDRVTIDWKAAKGKDLFKYELNYFPKDCECYGTVTNEHKTNDPYVVIEWDEKYHDHMYGNNQWNLVHKVIKLAEPVDQKKLIELRINKLYSKCKTTAHWSK